MKLFNMIKCNIKGKTDSDIERIEELRWDIQNQTVYLLFGIVALAIITSIFWSNWWILILIPDIIFFFVTNSLIDKNNEDYHKLIRRRDEENRVYESKMECMKLLNQATDMAYDFHLLDNVFIQTVNSLRREIREANEYYQLRWIISIISDLMMDLERKATARSGGQHQQKKQSGINNLSEIQKSLKTLGLDIHLRDVNIVNKRWRELMKKYHQDITKDNGEMAKKINVAHDILKEALQ